MLVGRGLERLTMDRLAAAARLGQSGVLVLVGDAGIGKSALLGDAVTRARGMRLLAVTGAHAEQDLPFAGLAQLLRAIPIDLDRLPEPQAAALGVALALRPGTGVDRFAVGAATLTLLTRMSEDLPLCVVVDDAHLLDRPSQEVIGFVARRLLADAVMILAAVRAGEPCLLLADDIPSLTLTGIDADATRELVQARTGRFGSVLATRMHDLTAGNPLAICELAADPDAVIARPPGAPVPVPSTVSALYARRAAALGSAARTALLLAATAGEDLRVVATACRILGIDVGALVEAERAGLIAIELDRIRFAHPLMRSAIYATAPAAERRRLHSALAEALVDGDPDRRAWHRVAAALGPDEDVAAEIEALGMRSADRGAYAVAATAFDRAARLSTDGAPRAERLVAAGSAAWRAGDGSWARTLLQQAMAAGRRPDVRARAGRLLGIVAARTGSLEEARDLLLSAAHMSADIDRAVAVVCYAEAVNACFYLADAATALDAGKRAEALVDDDLPTTAAVLGLMAAGMGRVLAGEDGSEWIKAGVARMGAGGAATTGDDAAWLVLGPLFLRDSRTGRDLVRRAVDELRARSAIGGLPHLLFHIARDSAATTGWPRAAAEYAEAIALAREGGQTTELAASLSGLAWLESRQGRADEARRHADEAEALAAGHQVHFARVWARFALGDLAVAEGDPGTAAQRYAEVMSLLDEFGVADVDLSPGPELVEALIRTGEPGRAREVGSAYCARAAAKGQPWALARAGRIRGLLCAEEEIDAQFSAALTLHDQTLDSYEEARTRLAYGARLRRARRRVDARRQLQTAADTFTGLGARPWARMAAEELEAAGGTARRPDGNPIEQLTPRELQIALLLAEGRTTRQAAAALFLSRKTVEYHLRHVYLKFGIDSRSQLADRMRSPTLS